MGFLKPIAILTLTSTLAACGSGGGGSSGSGTPSPSVSSVSADSTGLLTVAGKTTPNSTVTVTFPDGSVKEVTTDNTGNYNLVSNIPQSSGQVSVTVTNSNGTSAPVEEQSFTADLESKDVLKALYKATGTMPELSFKPSLGINTEAPQGADTAGMPMPFVDIFRTARPFSDQAASGTTFDDHGWVTKFAPSVNFAQTKLLQGTLNGAVPNGKYTVLYENANADSHLEFGSGPASNYTAELVNNVYEGSFDLNLSDFDDEENEAEVSSKNAISLNIRGDQGAGAETSIKNISFIMPGGTCAGNPFLHMSSAADCPDGVAFESFAERIKTDRNTIIFNPDYLLFLRNFKVIRMMNLMEASHGKAYCNQSDGCPDRVDTWDNRAVMDDAVWGGSDRTDFTKRNGAPVEVIVALANTLKRDIWVNMPHPADDNYITQFATYVKNNLNADSKVYIEYSNEIWNSGFTGHDYVASKGIAEGFDQNLPIRNNGQYNFGERCADPDINESRCGNYFAGLRYYSKRSTEIFNIWKNVFSSSTTTLVRVLGTSQGDTIRTDEMIRYVGESNVDAIAMAPYFYGCPKRPKGNNPHPCDDINSVPLVLQEAETVDDIFNIIDHAYDDSDKSNITGDSNGIIGTIAKIKNQLSITEAKGIDLITYEGGQHLTTSILTHFIEIPIIANAQLISAGDVAEEERTQILADLKEANDEISTNKATIVANANADGTILDREQAVIDTLNDYQTLAGAYTINVTDVLADNTITTAETVTMQSDFNQLREKRAQTVEAQKGPYRKLFKDANRDPRMKERYETFLNAWKDLSGEGTSLFTLYTLPQSYYRFGNFGIKEHLNKSRSESPKYDGIMTFQESVKECWWTDCNP